MSDLGDLTDFIKEGSLVDHDWLKVDEITYHDQDTLPLQNTDIIPDLQQSWRRVDPDNSPKLIPGTPLPPKSMYEVAVRSKEDTEKLSKKIEAATRKSLTIDPTGENLRKDLLKSFLYQDILQHKKVIGKWFKERGLLGGHYILAEDFDGCVNRQDPRDFVKRHANTATYLIRKSACDGCVKARTAPSGRPYCDTFSKTLVDEPFYTDHLATNYEQFLYDRGRDVKVASDGSPRDRIQKAFLSKYKASEVKDPEKPIQDNSWYVRPASAPGKVHLKVIQSSADRYEDEALSVLSGEKKASEAKKDFSEFKLAQQGAEVRKVLARELLRGLPIKETLNSLKVAFPVSVLQETKPYWKDLYAQAGLFGTVYVAESEFDSCVDTAKFLSRQSTLVSTVVAGDRCGSCVHNKVGFCKIYKKPLVETIDGAVTEKVAENVVEKYETLGFIPKGVVGFEENPVKTLKTAYNLLNKTSPKNEMVSSVQAYQAFTGGPATQEVVVTKGRINSIVRYASQAINNGIFGKPLSNMLIQNFGEDSVRASLSELKPVLAKQGVEGVYYVDPTVYKDYGNGCDTLARFHKNTKVSTLKEGPKCNGCVFQVKKGSCSKVSKTLEGNPKLPENISEVKKSAILATFSSPEVFMGNRGDTILEQYEVKTSSLDFELNPVAPAFDVELGLK